MFTWIKEKLQAKLDQRRPDKGWRGMAVFTESSKSKLFMAGSVRPVTLYMDGTVRRGAPVFEGNIVDCWTFLKNWKPKHIERYRTQWTVVWKEPR